MNVVSAGLNPNFQGKKSDSEARWILVFNHISSLTYRPNFGHWLWRAARGNTKAPLHSHEQKQSSPLTTSCLKVILESHPGRTRQINISRTGDWGFSMACRPEISDSIQVAR